MFWIAHEKRLPSLQLLIEVELENQQYPLYTRLENKKEIVFVDMILEI